MCGRYEMSETPATIAERFTVPFVPELPPNPELRPTEQGLVVRLDRRGQRECVALRWGLVPMWAKDIKFGARCINARAETIATASAFKAAFQQRRCLVPAAAFYEWSGPRGHKVQHRIALSNGEPLAFGGLWERWRDPAGSMIETFTIITTEANDQLRALHDRMPLIVPPDAFEPWLSAPSSELLRPSQYEFEIAPPLSSGGSGQLELVL
jgi:putative SOS response-associated peptidase YedK